MNVSLLQLSWEVAAGIGGAFILTLVWLVRLEAKVLYLEKDHLLHKKETDADVTTLQAKFDVMTQQLSNITASLAKIEGYLYAEKSLKGE